MPPSHWQKPHKPLLNSTVAGQNVFGFFLVGGGGGDLNLAERNLGGPGENPWKFSKFSFLKSLQMHPILKISSYIWGTNLLLLLSLHLSIIIGGSRVPLASLLATALMKLYNPMLDYREERIKQNQGNTKSSLFRKEKTHKYITFWTWRSISNRTDSWVSFISVGSWGFPGGPRPPRLVLPWDSLASVQTDKLYWLTNTERGQWTTLCKNGQSGDYIRAPL